MATISIKRQIVPFVLIQGNVFKSASFTLILVFSISNRISQKQSVGIHRFWSFVKYPHLKAVQLGNVSILAGTKLRRQPRRICRTNSPTTCSSASYIGPKSQPKPRRRAKLPRRVTQRQRSPGSTARMKYSTR